MTDAEQEEAVRELYLETIRTLPRSSSSSLRTRNLRPRTRYPNNLSTTAAQVASERDSDDENVDRAYRNCKVDLQGFTYHLLDKRECPEDEEQEGTAAPVEQLVAAAAAVARSLPPRPRSRRGAAIPKLAVLDEDEDESDLDESYTGERCQLCYSKRLTFDGYNNGNANQRRYRCKRCLERFTSGGKLHGERMELRRKLMTQRGLAHLV